MCEQIKWHENNEMLQIKCNTNTIGEILSIYCYCFVTTTNDIHLPIVLYLFCSFFILAIINTHTLYYQFRHMEL